MKSCCNGWRRTAKVSRSGTRGVPSRCFPAIPCWTWFVKRTRNRTPLPLPQKYPTQRALTCYTGFPSTTSLTKSSSTFFLWQQATVRTACIDCRQSLETLQDSCFQKRDCPSHLSQILAIVHCILQGNLAICKIRHLFIFTASDFYFTDIQCYISSSWCLSVSLVRCWPYNMI